jgi:hypothetical protein
MRPLLSIWIYPVKTFEYLSNREDSENRQMINILSILITIGIGIPRIKEFSKLIEQNKYIGLIIGIILCGLVGLIVFKYLLTWSYWVAEKIFKGIATLDQVRLVVAYSMIPCLIYLVIGLILIIPAVITQNFDLIFYRHPLTYFVVCILSIRNLVYGLSYFNNFSYGYGLLTVLIPLVFGELIGQLLIYWKH